MNEIKAKKIELLVPREEHNRMIAHAKELVKKRLDAKWEICRIALKLCYIPPIKGGRYDNKYSITCFAEDIGIHRKTLSCWILDYQSVFKKLDISIDKLGYSERIKVGSAISKTRKSLFNFNELSKDEIDAIDKNLVKKTFDSYLNEDVLCARLTNFCKNLDHHIFTFENTKFSKRHLNQIAEYAKSLDRLVGAVNKVKKQQGYA